VANKKPSAKQLAARRKFAAMAKARSKATKKKRTTKRRSKVTPMARSRRRAPAKKRRASKKYKTISLTTIGQVGWTYQTISGNALGDVVKQAMDAALNGQGDIVDIAMTEVQTTLDRVISDPVGLSVRAGLGIWGFSALKSFIGRKTIFKVGRWKLTT